MTALRSLERNGPIAVSELARKVRVDLSTMSRQLRPLEAAGLIARTSDPGDGRVAWLAVTTKGTRVLARVDRAVIDDFDAALGDWTEADRAQLASFLDRFRAGLVSNRAIEAGETGAGAHPSVPRASGATT